MPWYQFDFMRTCILCAIFQLWYRSFGRRLACIPLRSRSLLNLNINLDIIPGTTFERRQFTTWTIDHRVGSAPTRFQTFSWKRFGGTLILSDWWSHVHIITAHPRNYLVECISLTNCVKTVYGEWQNTVISPNKIMVKISFRRVLTTLHLGLLPTGDGTSPHHVKVFQLEFCMRMGAEKTRRL